jgi:uncharacterized protein (DUF4415 family)
LKTVDAHAVKKTEYAQLPEITDEMLARGRFKVGGKPVSRAKGMRAFARALRKAGRPKSANPREQIALRLPPQTVARWRASGPGWQTRMAEVLARTAPQ